MSAVHSWISVLSQSDIFHFSRVHSLNVARQFALQSDYFPSSHDLPKIPQSAFSSGVNQGAAVSAMN